MKPKEISEFSDSTLLIAWDDGHESIYVYDDLRQACPCATCRTERSKLEARGSGFKRIPMGVPKGKVVPDGMEEVGSYALRFNWNDGHDTGIYTFDFLRGLCSCEQCAQGAGASTAEDPGDGIT